ncbi:hypothetical protein AYX14_07136 [Cryptococcus neoformans]|nr:hypothetical protein AYX14_07136 [Cryptococcus neoformans var. grubii]
MSYLARTWEMGEWSITSSFYDFFERAAQHRLPYCFGLNSTLLAQK